MDIAELLKIRKRGESVGFVLSVFEQQVLLDSAKDNSRRGDVFHPSELCRNDFCPREWIYYQVDPSLRKSKVNVRQQLFFDVGKVLHTYMQEKFGNAGALFGVWECLRRCKEDRCFYMGFMPKNICEQEFWVYKEVTVFDEALNIRGSTDGIIIIGDKKYTFEFKTMNTTSFSTLVQPVVRDIEQACWYLDILSREGFYEWNKFSVEGMYENVQKIIDMPFDGSVLVYMDKDKQLLREFFTPISALKDKDFILTKNSSLFKTMDSKKQTLKQTLIHRKKGTLPDRLHQCDMPSSKRAQKCNAIKPCFKGVM